MSSHNAPSPEAVSLQLRGCLTRFLTTLTIAQRRESETSLPCAKNTLLAITILLTTSSHAIPPQDPVLTRVLNELLDCLQDVGLASVAAGCIRSMLLTSASRSPTDEVIARYLLPRLIAFLAGVPDDKGEAPIDPENARTSIAHTLASFIGTPAAVPRNRLPTAMPLVVSALLARAKREGPSVYKETATRLLEVATIDQGVFRSMVATSMTPEQKALVEEILRSTETNTSAGKAAGRDSTSSGVNGQQAVPSIALRMDF